MKYLKIRILEPGEGGMVYPTGYQNDIGNYAADHLYYDETELDNQSELVLLIPDTAFSPSMLRARVEEITESEVKQISEVKETRVEEIKDEAKIRRIEIKSRLGMALTTDETNAVDINHPDSAFSTSKILSDRVDDLKVKESKKLEK